jgi:hypothetical protein
MEYQSYDGREVLLRDVRDKIGMQAFEAPSVFGFYLPEYSPAGAVSENGPLPECLV